LVQFPDPPLPWTAFTEHWHDVYVACRAGQYVDCDGTATRIMEGGNLQMLLWTRGMAMKVTFLRVPPPGEAPIADAPSLADAVMAAGAETATKHPTKAHRPGPGEFMVPPAIEGAFSFRQSEAVDEDSAISAATHPVCAAQSCQAVITTDASAASMRVISMIGAVFPDGYTEPQLAFRLPPEH
jgi:hypothetical protein